MHNSFDATQSEAPPPWTMTPNVYVSTTVEGIKNGIMTRSSTVVDLRGDCSRASEPGPDRSAACSWGRLKRQALAVRPAEPDRIDVTFYARLEIIQPNRPHRLFFPGTCSFSFLPIHRSRTRSSPPVFRPEWASPITRITHAMG